MGVLPTERTLQTPKQATSSCAGSSLVIETERANAGAPALEIGYSVVESYV